MEDNSHLLEPGQFWDEAAATFDDQPDHGLRDPHVRAAWTGLLANWLPAGTSAVLDVGCGTGSLSVAMARLRYQVTGIDLSPAMIALAEEKAYAAGQQIAFQVMDAAALRFPAETFDALVCRHLLWTLPNPPQVLQRWAKLLKPQGRLILIEGYWSTGAGLHAPQLLAALPPAFVPLSVENLASRPEFWGKPVSDERYALIAGMRST